MAFEKAAARNTDEEEAEALREALALELEEDVTPERPAEPDQTEELAPARRPKISKMAIAKGVALVALVVGGVWLLNRWAAPPEVAPLAELEIRLDAGGYWIEGVQVSDLVDGAPVFFERAQLADRGAVPGTTVILFDGDEAPGTAGDHFRGELESRGFMVRAAPAPVVVEFSTRQAVED